VLVVTLPLIRPRQERGRLVVKPAPPIVPSEEDGSVFPVPGAVVAALRHSQYSTSRERHVGFNDHGRLADTPAVAKSARHCITRWEDWWTWPGSNRRPLPCHFSSSTVAERQEQSASDKRGAAFMRVWRIFAAPQLYPSDSARQHPRRSGMQGLRHKP
jgi:hypothetical protein